MTHHQDAISLLTADHRTVEQLFADYERGLQGPEAKRQVVDQLIRELSVHAAIEEAYFYPEVRKALGEGGELWMRACTSTRRSRRPWPPWRTWTRPMPPTTRRSPP
jgi:hemerythrin superfamily protein